MATVTGTREQFFEYDVITWGPLTTTNTDGSSAANQLTGDKCIQFAGTWGVGGTVVLQGSNDGTNWATLTDPQAAAISKTANGLEQVVESPVFIRPLVTGGDGTTSITAKLCIRRG